MPSGHAIYICRPHLRERAVLLLVQNPAVITSDCLKSLRIVRLLLLPVEYYHVVFTLPAPISAIAYTNKELIYGLLFDIAGETLRTIAADPKHLGARIGTTLVLHTWGSALTHHPHVHGRSPLVFRAITYGSGRPYFPRATGLRRASV
jgi:hypothetical protein